jgi:hypothetical protein
MPRARGRTRMKYWEIIADNLTKPVRLGAASQPWILAVERSGLVDAHRGDGTVADYRWRILSS